MSGLDGSAGPAPTVVIDLPKDWHEVPADPALLETWWGGVDGLGGIDPDVVHEARVRLRSLLVEARRDGLIFAAATVVVVDPEAGSDEEVQVLTASMAVVGIHDPGMDGTVSTFALQTLIRQDELEGDRQVIADPDVVYLGEHEALRVVEIELHPDEETNSYVPILAVTYLMASADRNGALQIGFRTPAVWMLEEFVGLFHDIAGTFRLVDQAR